MILESGNKVLVAHRRMFDREEPRYFVGEVSAYEAGIVKATGYSFVRDIASGNFIRKDDRRTKIISIVSAAFLVYQLPDGTDIKSIAFESHEGELTLTDGQHLRMNMAELPHLGQI